MGRLSITSSLLFFQSVAVEGIHYPFFPIFSPQAYLLVPLLPEVVLCFLTGRSLLALPVRPGLLPPVPWSLPHCSPALRGQGCSPHGLLVPVSAFLGAQRISQTVSRFADFPNLFSSDQGFPGFIFQPFVFPSGLFLFLLSVLFLVSLLVLLAACLTPHHYHHALS